MNGFSAATNFTEGTVYPTLVLGDGKVCTSTGCGGFTMIQCGNSSSTAPPQTQSPPAGGQTSGLSPVGYCGAPTIASAMLTHDVPQPRTWQYQGMDWIKGLTPNDCYAKCIQYSGYRCLSFLYGYNPGFGSTCMFSSLDRSTGLTVSHYDESHSNYRWDYYELKDCQPGARGGSAGQFPTSTAGQQPTYGTPAQGGPPAAATGCADPRTIGFMDQWLSNAIPVANGNYHFDQWGRLIGQNANTSISNIGQPVDPYTWATRCNFLWSVAPQLNSKNLGTMMSYIQQRLAGH
jgi:hypothetical protein